MYTVLGGPLRNLVDPEIAQGFHDFRYIIKFRKSLEPPGKRICGPGISKFETFLWKTVYLHPPGS